MKQRDFTIVLFSFFILTILWVLSGLYHNFITSTIEDPLSYQIAAIEGKFDTEALSDILKRKSVDPLYELSSSGSLPEVLEEESATESSEIILEDFDEGTESAELLP